VRCRSQSLCCEALNVGLQARRRGGKPNRRFLSGLNSVPWVVVGATGAHCKRIQYVELPTLSTGGSNFACGLFPLIYNEAFSIELPEVVVYGTHQVLAKRIRVGIAEATRMGSPDIAEALDHPKTTSMSWLVPRTPHEHFVSYRTMISRRGNQRDLQDGPFKGLSVLAQMIASKTKAAAIMLINLDQRDLVIDAFRGGARGIFCRGQSLEALPKCIRAVYQGQIWANNNELEFLLQLIVNLRPIQSGRGGLGTLLTPREREIVGLVQKT